MLLNSVKTVLPTTSLSIGATGIPSSKAGGWLCYDKRSCSLISYTHAILLPKLLEGLGRGDLQEGPGELRAYLLRKDPLKDLSVQETRI